jgi:hypothetical protein
MDEERALLAWGQDLADWIFEETAGAFGTTAVRLTLTLGHPAWPATSPASLNISVSGNSMAIFTTDAGDGIDWDVFRCPVPRTRLVGLRHVARGARDHKAECPLLQVGEAFERPSRHRALDLRMRRGALPGPLVRMLGLEAAA